MPDAVLLTETLLVIVVPVIAGAAVLRLAQTTPAIAGHAVRTALLLFVVLIVAVSLLSPGSDLARPAIGDAVAVIVCSAVLIALRRREGARAA